MKKEVFVIFRRDTLKYLKFGFDLNRFRFLKPCQVYIYINRMTGLKRDLSNKVPDIGIRNFNFVFQ